MRLQYELGRGAAKCDGEAMFRKLVASELQAPDPFVLTGPAEAVLTVRVEHEPPGFVGVVDLRDLEGNVLAYRRSAERTCQDAVDRAIMTVLLEVFPQPKPADPPAPPTPPGASEKPPSCENPCVQELREEVEDLREALERERQEREAATKALQAAMEAIRVGRMDLTWALVAGPLLSVNLTPDVGPGVYAGAELRAGPLGIGLELRAVLPSRVQIGRYDTDFSEYVAMLVPCGRYSYFFGCAVAGGGFEMAYDSNAPGTKHSNGGGMLQLGGRLGLELPFAADRLAVRAWGEVLYTTPSVHLYYYQPPSGTIDSTWDRPDVSGFLGLGFVVKFGNEESR